MSRRVVLLIFWVLGFGVGSIGYLCLPGVAGWFAGIIPNFVNQAIIGALIAGMIGSAVSTFSVVTWANRSSTV